MTTTPQGLPAWSRVAAIGDYDGDPNKLDCETEGAVPYAASLYRDFQAARGTGYTTKTGTFVHCENLALARFWAAIGFRTPEKVRANTTPARSDEKLDEWVEVLGIPRKLDDPKWLIRQRCAAHNKAVLGNTIAKIEEALSELLGDVFVSVSAITGTDLATPPLLTYWPGVNPGPGDYSLGGGAWISERSHIVVIVDKGAAPSLAEFYDLVNVQMFQLLDRMLPATCTFDWATSEGFLLDISQLDFDGLT